MIHHSHVKCDDCGERHNPGAQSECIEILKSQVEEWKESQIATAKDLDTHLARAEKAEAKLAEMRKRADGLRKEVLDLLCKNAQLKNALELERVQNAHERKAWKVEGILAAASHCEESEVPVPIEELVGTTKRQFSNTVIRYLAAELREMAAEIERGEGEL